MVFQKTAPGRADSQYKVSDQKLSTPGPLTEPRGQCDWGGVMRGREEAEAEGGGYRGVRSCPYRALQDCWLLLQ